MTRYVARLLGSRHFDAKCTSNPVPKPRDAGKQPQRPPGQFFCPPQVGHVQSGCNRRHKPKDFRRSGGFVGHRVQGVVRRVHGAKMVCVRDFRPPTLAPPSRKIQWEQGFHNVRIDCLREVHVPSTRPVAFQSQPVEWCGPSPSHETKSNARSTIAHLSD